MIPQDDYDLSEELTRKSGEALSWLENEFERGAMSPNAYFVSLMAVDMTTLGLIPDSYSQWASERRKQIGVGDSDDREAFMLPGSNAFTTVKLDRANSVVELVAYKDGRQQSTKSFDMSQETDSVRAASEKFKSVCQFFIGKGYTRLFV